MLPCVTISHRVKIYYYTFAVLIRHTMHAIRYLKHTKKRQKTVDMLMEYLYSVDSGALSQSDRHMLITLFNIEPNDFYYYCYEK